MTRPPWKPSNDPREQQAFIRWVIDRLDEEDERTAAAANNNPAVMPTFRALAELLPVIQRAGLRLTAPFREPARSRGRPARTPASPDFSDFDRAALDVPRIRTLFVRHWGKRNRTSAPLAEQIAAHRWELSPADTNRLIDRFQRKS